MPTIETIAYLAGFFDGEGCIHLAERVAYTKYLTKGGSKEYKYVGFFAIVRVSQNVRRPLELFQSAYGGNIRVCGHPGEAGRNWRHYEWECPRSRMVEMLQALAPFLLVKREEAEIAAQFMRTFRPGKRIDDDLRKQRRIMIARVKAAKTIGRVNLPRGAA